MRPVIGLTHSLHLDEDTLHLPTSYVQSVIAAGGTPLVLPATRDVSVIHQYLNIVDGVLFAGGDDVNPLHYGENTLRQCGDICPPRDEYEMALCREAVGRRIPVLGICRGIQLINVALGGTLYQDLPSQKSDSIAHSQKQKSQYASHAVSISDGSRLHRIFSSGSLMVNTFHHQAVKQPADRLTVTAKAPDGVIEAVEMSDHPFFLAVQWHPERMQEHMNLFRAFVEACRA